MIILDIILNYILVIIYDSFIALILVLFLLFLFKIKDSNIRILFFFIPLIKPFLIILEDFNLNKLYLTSRPIVLGFRLPSPNTILNRIDNIDNSPIYYSKINLLIILAIIISILLILIMRWINIYLLYKRIAYEEKVSKNDIPDVYSIINNYAKKINIKVPEVNLTHRNFFTPFVIGIKRNTVVLSPRLIDNLTKIEMEIIIQHELAHIKRKDNLISWIALIFRDLLFFNPIAHISYHLIKFEQEKASDKLVMKSSKLSVSEIVQNIISIILKIKELKSNQKMNYLLAQNSPFILFKIMKFKLISFRIKSIIYSNPKKNHISTFPKILTYLLFILLLFIQIILIIKLNNDFIFLR